MQVTPELLDWVKSQRQAGFNDEALLKAMVTAGYTEPFSRSLLTGQLPALRSFGPGSSASTGAVTDAVTGAVLAQADTSPIQSATSHSIAGPQRSASIPVQRWLADAAKSHQDLADATAFSSQFRQTTDFRAPGIDSRSGGTTEQHASDPGQHHPGRCYPAEFFRALGSDAFFTAAQFNTFNVRQAADAQVRIVMQMAYPRVAVFEGLLTSDECDELVSYARPRLASSLTVDRDNGSSVQHHARVSHGMFFQRRENPLVARLEARMSALLGFPESNGEGLQILNYQPGGKYDPHQDYFDPTEAGSQMHLTRGGQRVGTLIVYLNTPEAGGGTVFPDIGLTVSAVKGHAVFFSYPVAHPASLCLHGGNPVVQGEKWIATKWIRESAFA